MLCVQLDGLKNCGRVHLHDRLDRVLHQPTQTNLEKQLAAAAPLTMMVICKHAQISHAYPGDGLPG